MKQESYNYDLLMKYLLGEASTEEVREVEDWIKESDDHQKILDELRQLVEVTDFNAAAAEVNTGKAWSKLKLRMNQDGQAGKVIKIDSRSEKIDSFRFKNYFRIAAAIIGVILVSALLFRYLPSGNASKYSEAITTEERLTQTLADGSVVTLNKHSVLKYPKEFKKGERRVQLTGEAFFEVTKDPDHPFIIEANGAEIKVLGTSFNVSAYANTETVEVIVETGKVQLKGNKEQETVVLSPGKKGIYNKSSNKLSVSENNEAGYAFWRSRKLTFRNTSLKQVVETLNNYYNAHLSLQNANIGGCMFTATFEGDSLNTILDVLTNTFQLKIEEDASGKVLTGTGCNHESL